MTLSLECCWESQIVSPLGDPDPRTHSSFMFKYFIKQNSSREQILLDGMGWK